MSLQIDEQMIRQAIQSFLTAQYDKKTEKEQKQLEKAIEKNDVVKINEINELLQPQKEKYQKDNYLSYMADWMSKQLSLGTHISKGVHSSSKGDNLIFNVQHQIDFVGHHSLKQVEIDASGNAAALPLAAFLNYPVLDNLTIGELIKQEHPSLKGVFHSNLSESDRLQSIFYQKMLSQIHSPKTDKLNKQLLWAIAENQYRCIVPLYPISIANYVYHVVREINLSEYNIQARKNRNQSDKSNQIKQPYLTINNLATIKLGGSNPRNVSRLINKQQGINYLLPSIPPVFKQSKQININPKAKSIFEHKAIEYFAKEPLQAVFEVIESIKNNVHIRTKRQRALDEIIECIFNIAHNIQMNYPAGWSNEYRDLSKAQKYWLDPYRAELVGEEEFKQNRENADWHQEIAESFAEWLQDILRTKFESNKSDFGKPEFDEWVKEMKKAIRKSLRLGQGIF